MLKFLRKKIHGRAAASLKALMFTLVICIGLGLHLYTQQLISGLREESRELVSFYARLFATLAETESNSDLSFLFENVARKTHFPVINTDIDKNPIWWKGLSIDPDDRSEEAFERVQKIVNKLDKAIDPVPINYMNITLGYLYYGDSRMIQELRWLPAIQIGLAGLFILLGFAGFSHIKKSEQRYIWVGMAKETAHQIGTPLSSLMGWIEMLGQNADMEMQKRVKEMQKDLSRLNLVSQRFSQIGSKPDLKKTDLTAILHETAVYINRRTPSMNRKVTIKESYQPVPPVAINRGLFQWAVENILKNSADAMDKTDGIIHLSLSLSSDQKYAEIECSDTERAWISVCAGRYLLQAFQQRKGAGGSVLILPDAS